MNAEQRAALRKLAEEATPGPWSQGWSEVGIECVWLNGLSEPLNEMGDIDTWIDCATKANAGLIAAANPQSILELLDYIETLEKDATRYMALRRVAVIEDSITESMCDAMECVSESIDEQGEVSDFEFDRMVDAAVAVMQGEKG